MNIFVAPAFEDRLCGLDKLYEQGYSSKYMRLIDVGDGEGVETG